MPGVSETIAVEVPDIGDYESVPIIEILVSPGDTVAIDDPLLTLESDKAAMDVPAPAAGTVEELRVKVGEKVSQGTMLLTLAPIDAADSTEAPSQASALVSAHAPVEAGAPDSIASATAAEEAREDESPQTPPAGESAGPAYASPSIRRLARERDIDLSTVSGSGRKGRITADDLNKGPAPPQGAGPGLGMKLEVAPWPSVDFEQFGVVERVPRSRIARISAPNLVRNWVMIPHVTHDDEADVTELEAWRKRLNQEHALDGIKLTMLTFLIAACVATLKEYPHFNASLDGEELVLKRYWNIGFAAETPAGLVVPVIKDAERKGLLQLATELSDLSSKARAGKLAPAQMKGGTFTISSLGGIGGTGFTPIINAPEVAILGVTRAAIKPVWSAEESSFQPKLILPLSLSYDHRVVDGAAAARFAAHLVRVLSDLRRALL